MSVEPSAGLAEPEPIAVLAAGFARACRARPDQVTDHVFSVGGRPIRARVAGHGVARMLERSLARAPENGSPGRGLKLELWDEEATAVAPGQIPNQQQGIVRAGPAGEELGIWSEGRYIRYAGPDFEIRLDRSEQRAVGWLRSERLLSSWHRARPLQTLFIHWLATGGTTVVHAAMVASDGTGVLLAGPPHCGKSTSTAACGAGGLDLLGDETIAVDTVDGRVFGHCVHAAVKLRHEGLSRHPELKGRTYDCGPPWTDDAVAFLGDVFPDQVVARAEVGALAFPVLVAEPDTTFSPIGPAEALRTLTGCLLSIEPGSVGTAFAQAAELVDRLPIYRVCVGTDTTRIPEAIGVLVRRVRPRSGAISV